MGQLCGFRNRGFLVHHSHQGTNMNKKSRTSKDTAADKLVKGIKRKSRKRYSAEEKIRIVLAGLRGEESIATLFALGNLFLVRWRLIA
jgi:hypothetical protein